MATILRGKHKGRIVRIEQFCNDWFMVDIHQDEQGVVISPTSLQLDAAEVERVLTARDRGQAGTMFFEFDLDAQSGLFRKVRRPR